MLNGGLLAAETTQPPHPEDAGTEVSLSCQMIEEKPRFPADLGQVEAILHYEEDIDVVRLALLRDKRAIDGEPGQKAGRVGRMVDVLQTIRDRQTLKSLTAEAFDHLRASRPVHAFWQVTGETKPGSAWGPPVGMALLASPRSGRQLSRPTHAERWLLSSAATKARRRDFTECLCGVAVQPLCPALPAPETFDSRFKPQVKERPCQDVGNRFESLGLCGR